MDSQKLTKKGNIKKTAKCYSRIFYNKKDKKYILLWDHSDFCCKRSKIKYQNFADIQKEIKNYKYFLINLIEYLETNPIIKYKDIKKRLLHIILNIIAILRLKLTHLKIFIIIGADIAVDLKNILYLFIIKLKMAEIS